MSNFSSFAPPPPTPKSGTRREAAIGQVWTRHCRSSRACPTAFIALSVHHGQREGGMSRNRTTHWGIILSPEMLT